MANKLKKIKEVIETNKESSVSPMDILNPNTVWVNESVSSARYAICKACPELIKLTKQCSKCGCFMNIKTRMEKADCPMRKW